jgi:hypothetical protein
MNRARSPIVARAWCLKISVVCPFSAKLYLFSMLGIPLRVTFRVCSPLEPISSDEALNGSTVKVKDGGCLPAVPAGLIEDELQVASLQLIHARPVRDPSLFDTAGTAWPVAGIRDFRREAVRCDEAV